MMASRPHLPWLLTGLLLALGSCQKQTPTVVQTPALTISPAFLDLGEVTFGERASGVFTLRNDSDQAVVVSRIGPLSCSCASAELLLPQRSGAEARRRLDGGRINLSLAPGETAEVHFTLDTSRYRQPTSRKVGSIPVVLQDSPGLILEWGADIWTPFQCEPWMTDFGEVGMRQQPSGFVLVVSHDTIEFSVDVDQVVDGWHVVSDRVSSDDSVRRSYRLTFTAPEELPEGPFRQNFEFQTDLMGAPPIRFSVQGRAVPDLFLSPARLVLDPDRGRSEVELRVVQRAKDKQIGDLRMGPLPDGLHLLSEQALDEQHRLFRFAWTGEAPSQTWNQDLVIETDHEEQPQLRLALTVLPARQDS